MNATIKPLGDHETQITQGNDMVFFSYGVPVAAFINGMYFATEKKWSVTTSKHIKRWLGDHTAAVRSQEWFDRLIQIEIK